jgi:adenylate cyclase
VARVVRRDPESLDAWAAYQRGLWHLIKFTADDNSAAQTFFRQAIDLDLTFTGGYWGLAAARFYASYIFPLRDPLEAPSSIEALARQAVALDGSDAEARSWLGLILFLLGDYKGGLAEIECPLVLSSNLAIAHGALGFALIWSGRSKEGLAALQRCFRLDPRAPSVGAFSAQVAVGHYPSRDYEAAVGAAEQAIRSNPDFPVNYFWLPAALGQLGRTAEASAALQKAIAVGPRLFDVYVRQRVPPFRPEDYAHLLEGLRKAGWEG